MIGSRFGPEFSRLELRSAVSRPLERTYRGRVVGQGPTTTQPPSPQPKGETTEAASPRGTANPTRLRCRSSPYWVFRHFTVGVVGISLFVQGAFLTVVKVPFDTPCKPDPAAFTVGIVAVGRNHPPSLHEVWAMHFADIARSKRKGWSFAQSGRPPLSSDDYEIGIVGNPIHRLEKAGKDGFVNRVGWRSCILTRDHGTGDQQAAAQECYECPHRYHPPSGSG